MSKLPLHVTAWMNLSIKNENKANHEILCIGSFYSLELISRVGTKSDGFPLMRREDGDQKEAGRWLWDC